MIQAASMLCQVNKNHFRLFIVSRLMKKRAKRAIIRQRWGWGFANGEAIKKNGKEGKRLKCYVNTRFLFPTHSRNRLCSGCVAGLSLNSGILWQNNTTHNSSLCNSHTMNSLILPFASHLQ